MIMDFFLLSVYNKLIMLVLIINCNTSKNPITVKTWSNTKRFYILSHFYVVVDSINLDSI